MRYIISLSLSLFLNYNYNVSKVRKIEKKNQLLQKDRTKNDNENTEREDERGSKWSIERTTCVDTQKMYLWIFIYARLNKIKKKEENNEWKKKIYWRFNKNRWS